MKRTTLALLLGLLTLTGLSFGDSINLNKPGGWWYFNYGQYYKGLTWQNFGLNNQKWAIFTVNNGGGTGTIWAELYYASNNNKTISSLVFQGSLYGLTFNQRSSTWTGYWSGPAVWNNYNTDQGGSNLVTHGFFSDNILNGQMFITSGAQGGFSTPEPSSLVLIATGLAGIAGCARKKISALLR